MSGVLSGKLSILPNLKDGTGAASVPAIVERSVSLTVDCSRTVLVSSRICWKIWRAAVCRRRLFCSERLWLWHRPSACVSMRRAIETERPTSMLH